MWGALHKSGSNMKRLGLLQKQEDENVHTEMQFLWRRYPTGVPWKDRNKLEMIKASENAYTNPWFPNFTLWFLLRYLGYLSIKAGDVLSLAEYAINRN